MDRRVALAAGIAVLIVVPAVGAVGGAEDEIVEGHTTYKQIQPDEDRTLSVIGDVHCHVEVLEIRIGVPPSVGSADAECSAEVLIFGTLLDAPDPRGQALQPTGQVLEAEGPQGHTWETTEYEYRAQGQVWNTWVVEAGPDRVDPATDEPYSFVVGFPDEAAGEDVRLRAGSLR